MKDSYILQKLYLNLVMDNGVGPLRPAMIWHGCQHSLSKSSLRANMSQPYRIFAYSTIALCINTLTCCFYILWLGTRLAFLLHFSRGWPTPTFSLYHVLLITSISVYLEILQKTSTTNCLSSEVSSRLNFQSVTFLWPETG